MATIILKGADFSANNIGRITPPRENLNAFTKKIFSVCTRYSLYSEQAFLIDDFINYLDNEGLLEHLSFFMAPWLASDINEATYNIAAGTQLQHGENVTFNDGVIKALNANYVIIGDDVVPAINFICTIGSKVFSYNAAISYLSNNEINLALISMTANNTTIFPTFNTSVAGYKTSLDMDNYAYRLWNIKGLSDLDTNGTTVNGGSVIADTSYDKSNEPLRSPHGFNKLKPGGTTAMNNTKIICFAGDGTTLTDAQVISMNSALATLQAGLAALEA